MFLNYKVQEALRFLKENEPPEGYVVKFSGGKDSIVTYDLVKKAGVKHEVYYNFTTLDPPEVLRFMKEYYPEVKWIKPKRSFWQWLVRVGPPTKMKRWCCTKLKHAANPREAKRRIIVGVRAEESWKRAKRGRISYNPDGRNYVYAPIFHFTEEDVWCYIEEYNLPYPSLYDEGFNRVACVVCPFLCGNDRLLEKHKERWRKYYEKFEKCVAEYFERKRPFYESIGVKNVRELLEKWYKGLPVAEEPEEGKSFDGSLWESL